MQRLKEHKFEQFKLILIMHIVDSLWIINWNLKTKHWNVDTDELSPNYSNSIRSIWLLLNDLGKYKAIQFIFSILKQIILSNIYMGWFCLKIMQDDTHTSVMQRLKEQKFEQFKLILIMHIVDSLWNINWNLKTKHWNVDTDKMKIHHRKISFILHSYKV
jgi:hypothetical protein